MPGGNAAIECHGEGTKALNSPKAGAGRTAGLVKNHHPTVKPIGVMRWLCKLVGGQRGSVILDPFMGSGTTGAAAMLEGFAFIGIEREPEYIQIAEARIRHHLGAREGMAGARAQPVAYPGTRREEPRYRR